MRRSQYPMIVFRGALAALLIALATPVVAVDLPDSPDGTLRVVAEQLAERHPEVLWHALPPTYQQDITELTHGYAAKISPSVWDSAFDLGRKLVGIMADKKEIILASSMMESAGEEREEIEDNWDTMVNVLGELFSSDVSRLETLKTIDWEQFLSTTGRELMNKAAEASKASGDDAYDREVTQMLKKTTVEVISREGDQATLLVSAPDEDPEEVRLTRVEGRWVPSDMAEDWDSEVADAKQRLASLTDEEIQQGSMQAMMVIGMVDGVLTQLESVETTEEFEQALQGILGPLMGGGLEPDFGEEPEADESTDV